MTPTEVIAARWMEMFEVRRRDGSPLPDDDTIDLVVKVLARRYAETSIEALHEAGFHVCRIRHSGYVDVIAKADL